MNGQSDGFSPPVVLDSSMIYLQVTTLTLLNSLNMLWAKFNGRSEAAESDHEPLVSDGQQQPAFQRKCLTAPSYADAANATTSANANAEHDERYPFQPSASAKSKFCSNTF